MNLASEGPIPVVRRENDSWPDVQKAFHAAAMERGYARNPDLNGAAVHQLPLLPQRERYAADARRSAAGGVSGLWVADSSIMPQVTRANTNATAIMIGERVADWIAAG